MAGIKDINVPNSSDGNTPLIITVLNGNVEILQMLLNVPSIDVNAQNRNLDTALHVATRTNNVTMIAMLLTHPQINPNIINNDGHTALSLALALNTSNPSSNQQMNPQDAPNNDMDESDETSTMEELD